MDKNACLYIGRSIKTHGYKGEIKLAPGRHFPTSADVPNVIFIEIDGLPVPFFVESWRLLGDDSALIKLHDVSDVDQARLLCGKDVFIERRTGANADTDTLMPDELSGYTVVDKRHGHLGHIDEIIRHGMQELISIKTETEEILIPLNESIITGIDRKNRMVQVDTPEGLIGLNRRP